MAICRPHAGPYSLPHTIHLKASLWSLEVQYQSSNRLVLDPIGSILVPTDPILVPTVPIFALIGIYRPLIDPSSLIGAIY